MLLTVSHTPSPAKPHAVDPQAMADFGDGASLLARASGPQEVFRARTMLSHALLSGGLNKSSQQQAVHALTLVAGETIFSRTVYPGDPYTFAYQMPPGQTLGGAIARLGLRVNAAEIEAINGIDASDIKPGQSIKMIRGPFCAIINKSTFTMDIFLKPAGLEPLFVKRISVGLGKSDKTPSGMFLIARKAEQPSWKALPDSKIQGFINYGEKGYPFGKKALWMGLQGMDESTRHKSGFALHSTSSQSSIGKAKSHGCIRIGDNNIDTVYAMMREGVSTVQIRD
jgi:lipoprotein-anchoring transpeptidase ErfK/SrfK